MTKGIAEARAVNSFRAGSGRYMRGDDGKDNYGERARVNDWKARNHDRDDCDSRQF